MLSEGQIKILGERLILAVESAEMEAREWGVASTVSWDWWTESIVVSPEPGNERHYDITFVIPQENPWEDLEADFNRFLSVLETQN